MSEPMFELPFGTVTGTYLVVRHDGTDEDQHPDVQPLNGTVTLTPTVPAGVLEGALAEIAPVPLRILGGQIVDDDQEPGARILANDADMGVEDWAWRARVVFDDSTLRLKPRDFKVGTGETVSLTAGYVPVESAPYQLVQGEPGESAYEIMVRRGDFVGTEEEWVDYYFNRETGGGGGGETSWAAVTGKPTAFPPTVHEHTIEQVNGLGAALDGKQPAGAYATEAYVQDQISQIPDPDLSGLVSSGTVTSIWTGTAAQYAAVSPKEPTTLYLIT